MNGGFFLLGIIVLFFALWLVGGGPDRPISFAGPYLTPIETTGDTADAYGGARTPGRPGLLGDLLGDRGTSIASGETSTYRSSISLSQNTRGATGESPEEEYIVIRASAGTSEGVRISGWKLVSAVSGASLTIPEGVATLRTGSVNQASAVVLMPNEEAIIVTGRSPVGASFKETLCTGYLEQYQEFVPSLSNQCPVPLAEFDDYFGNDGDPECESATRNILYCETTPRPSSSLSSSCRTFLSERLSYNGCVRAHERESDFASPTWRLFGGSSRALWNDERDTIRLVDETGKIVDVLSY